MSDLLSFGQLGFHHIVSPDALDHILFLLALAAIYQGRTWRQSLWVISAFTVGHSITLALAATGTLLLPQRITEFLIPLTIVATGIENVVVRARAEHAPGGRYRPLFAGVFGLVHGSGFASYLRQLFTGSVLVPLLGFNLGIELGQIVVLAVAASSLGVIDRTLVALRLPANAALAFRVRVVAVSLIVVVVATHMAAVRFPR